MMHRGQARGEARMNAAGFTSWEEVVFDDGHREMDDARKGDGRRG